MISLTIGVFIIGAGIQLFLGSKQNYRTIEAMSRIQEDGRYIMDLLAADFRMIGGAPCGETQSTVNVLENSATNTLLDPTGAALQGYESGSVVSGLPSSGEGAPLSTSDFIEIKFTDSQEYYLVSSHNPSTATFDLNKAPAVTAGDVGVVCSPLHTAVFQVTASGPGASIAHSFSEPSMNCTERLGAPGPSTCAAAGGTPYTFEQDAVFFKVRTRIYYVGTGSDGTTPSLFRADLEPDAGLDLALGTPQELIMGVEDFQVQYGVDADADNAADSYARASAISDWDTALSVRFSLVLSSENEVLDSSQSYVIEGVAQSPSDRLMRRVFTSTVGIRNRLME